MKLLIKSILLTSCMSTLLIGSFTNALATASKNYNKQDLQQSNQNARQDLSPEERQRLLTLVKKLETTPRR